MGWTKQTLARSASLSLYVGFKLYIHTCVNSLEFFSVFFRRTSRYGWVEGASVSRRGGVVAPAEVDVQDVMDLSGGWLVGWCVS